MKRILSVMLAVIMVLSTVSFAAPMAWTGADSAIEISVDLDAPAAELADEAELYEVVDTAKYGIKLFEIDFENFNVGDTIAEGGANYNDITTLTDDVHEDWTHLAVNLEANGGSNTVAIVAGTEDNKYIEGSQGWAQIRVYNPQHDSAPEGIYTYVYDTLNNNPGLTISSAIQGYWYDGTQYPAVTVSHKIVDSLVSETGVWDTVAGQWDGSSSDYTLHYSNQMSNTVCFDNIKLYYRPLEVDVYIGEDVCITVTTDGVDVSELIAEAGLEAPLGYVVAGLSLTEGGEVLKGTQYFFEETTLYPVYAEDTSIDPEYGKQIFNVDFEKEGLTAETVNTTYAKLQTVTDEYRSDFDLSNITTFTSGFAAGTEELVTEDGNTYFKAVSGGAYNFMRMTKYNIDWPEGVYTFMLDVKSQSASSASYQVNNDYTLAVNKKDFAAGNKDWQTVRYQYIGEMSSDITGAFFAFNDTANGEICFDNFKIFYKPETVTVTIVDGEEEYEISDVSTSGEVFVSDLIAEFGIVPFYGKKVILSKTPGGESIGDAFSLVSDAKLYIGYEEDTSANIYGKLLFNVDFETAKAQSWWGHSQDYNNSVSANGAWVYDIASYYDPMFVDQNFRIRFISNESVHVDQQTVGDGNGNHYNVGSIQTRWPNLTINNYGHLTSEPGVYTYMFDTMVSGGNPTNSASPAGLTILDPFSGQLDAWDRIIVQTTLDEEGEIPSGNIANHTFDATDIGVVTIAYDNLQLFYKPVEATVSLIIDGEVLEIGNYSTAGVAAKTILEDAGVTAPYGMRPYLTNVEGGESLGTTINLYQDAKFYIGYEEDTTIDYTYGTLLAEIDFENVTDANVVDNHLVSYASYYDPDWSNAFVNFEVGAGAVVTENGNRFVKGGQGWAQIRFNDNMSSERPEGVYTYMYDTIDFGSTPRAINAAVQQYNGNPKEDAPEFTWISKFSGALNTWDHVAVAFPEPKHDYTLHYTDASTSDVGFDNIKLYYKPAEVSLTVVDTNGDEIIGGEVVSTNGFSATELLEAYGVEAPYGMRPALAFTQGGEALNDNVILVSDATLYVVYTKDEKYDAQYGEALIIIDFEREDMQGWSGTTQDIANTINGNGAYVSESASYYDERFEGKNYRVRFVANESLSDQKTVVDENGNHYTSGTNTTQWPQVYQTNYGGIEGDAGVYTYMFDVMTTASASAFGAGANMTRRLDTVGNPEPNKWHTIVVQYDQAEYGKMVSAGPVAYFNAFEANGVATISYDNFKLFYKPFTASVSFVDENGDEWFNVDEVSTQGITVSELIDDNTVDGYKILGVNFAGETFGLNDTIVLPGDVTVELVLVSDDTDYTPATTDEVDVRDDTVTGIRYKAEMAAANKLAVDTYGWVVAAADKVDNEYIEVGDANTKVGYAKLEGEQLVADYFADDDYINFTVVVHNFQRPDVKIIARPFAVVGEDYYYGEPIAYSYFEAGVPMNG